MIFHRTNSIRLHVAQQQQNMNAYYLDREGTASQELPWCGEVLGGNLHGT